MDKKENMLDFKNNTNERKILFTIDEFEPELYDCDTDGSCSSGHNHNNKK